MAAPHFVNIDGNKQSYRLGELQLYNIAFLTVKAPTLRPPLLCQGEGALCHVVKGFKAGFVRTPVAPPASPSPAPWAHLILG
mmetsp:Transcript_17138/g.54492  ORF Transcript_17138/g.54492 Transcript_17138/m.54492 type:complete len:82 (-) Transcript_17138:2232-2477(-)